MADVAAARAEIQKVVSFLVNRFGSEEEVFNHLTLALDHLQEPPPLRPVIEATVPVPSVEVSIPIEAAGAGEESEPGSSEEELAPSAAEAIEPVAEELPQPPPRHITRRRR
jgi:hypothetical protein